MANRKNLSQYSTLASAPIEGNYFQRDCAPHFLLIVEIGLRTALGVALAEGFEEDDAGGYAYV